MSNIQNKPLDGSPYGFNPTYDYSLEQLLSVTAPKAPEHFAEFWQACYQNALTVDPRLHMHKLRDDASGRQLFEISYTSTDQFQINGWLLLPGSGIVKRGFVIGHGYGGRDGPDWHLPFKDAALLFPCFRGLAKSKQASIPSDPYGHVVHRIEQKETYVIRGCVEDLWLAVSALLSVFPHLEGRLGYLGISFGGGIGALALAWEQRIARGHLNVPTFGHQPLRIRLKSLGSACSLQQYYHYHKKPALKVLRFYDAATAAQYINIPMHFACAKFDPCVAPPGQFAIYNAVPGVKRLYILEAGHHPYAMQSQQEGELLNELQNFFEPLGQ